MFRKVCMVALFLTACGEPVAPNDGGLDAGPPPLMASGTASGTYGFTVKTSLAASQDGGVNGAPVAVILYDTVLPCPLRFDQSPPIEGQGLVPTSSSSCAGTFALTPVFPTRWWRV